jgi:hypothetical protein
MDAASRLTQAQAQLDAVNAAITARLTGSVVESYSVNGRSMQYAKLADLNALKRDLERTVAALSGAGSVQVQFARPT